VSPTGSDDHPGLDSALEAAAPGDTLLLTPGLYLGTHTLVQGVSIIGLDGAEATVLDADGGRYVLYGMNIDSTTVISGLTLQNGMRDAPSSGAGGVFLYQSSPIIVNNIFRGHLGYLGPGVYANHRSSPVIAFNVFHDNEGKLGGAVTAYQDCAPLVYNNFVYDNRAVSGGAILSQNSAPVIMNNTIVGNEASEAGGGGAIYCSSSPALIEGNVIAHNSGSGAIYWLNAMRPATVRRNLVWENAGGAAGGKCPDFVDRDGNCRADPEFVDMEARDLSRRPAPNDAPPCLRASGAAAWDSRQPPEVPGPVVELWRAWRADKAAP
jgi:hypothetical protein